jgi:pilus assembly protein CpaE
VSDVTERGHRVVLGIAAEPLTEQVASLVRESDELDVAAVTRSSGELLQRVGDGDVDVVLLHEDLGPLPMIDCARQLGTRFPDVGVVLLVRKPTPELLRAALQSGARDVLAVPPSLEELHGALRAAGDWARALAERTAGAAEAELAQRSAGTMIAVAGAKGGVGTTTVAVQVALEAAQAPGDPTVCLIDFDLQTGDVRTLLDLSHRRSVSDLVEVADNLTSGQLAASLYKHASGLRILLPPAHGEQAEEVTGPVARTVLGGIRSRYDIVIVDVGSVMTEASVMATEMADQVVVVATPDVPALRAANRLLELWTRIDARQDEVSVLLNRTSKQREVQPDFAAKVLAAPLLDTTIPSGFAQVEAAANTGVPDRLADGSVRAAMRRVAVELGVAPSSVLPRARGRRPALRVVREQAGVVAVETAGLALTVMVIIALLWQIVLVGATFMLAGHAAREGARDLAVGKPEATVTETAVADLPTAWARDAAVAIDDRGVAVTLGIPALMPGVTSPWTVSSRAGQVKEG